MRIVVETFLNSGEPSSAKICVRPVVGQFDVDYRVWCSASRREIVRPNRMFLVDATWVLSEVRRPQLRIALDSEWQSLSIQDAKNFITKLQAEQLRPPS